MGLFSHSELSKWVLIFAYNCIAEPVEELEFVTTDNYFVPLDFAFFTSSTGFSFFSFLLVLGTMSSKGLNKTYRGKKDLFPNLLKIISFEKNYCLQNTPNQLLILQTGNLGKR